MEVKEWSNKQKKPFILRDNEQELFLVDKLKFWPESFAKRQKKSLTYLWSQLNRLPFLQECVWSWLPGCRRWTVCLSFHGVLSLQKYVSPTWNHKVSFSSCSLQYLSCVFDVTADLHFQETVTVRWFLLVEDVQEMIMMNNCLWVIGGKCLKARVLVVLLIAWFYMVTRDATACPLKRWQPSTYKSQDIWLFPCRWIWTFENAFLPFNS